MNEIQDATQELINVKATLQEISVKLDAIKKLVEELEAGNTTPEQIAALLAAVEDVTTAASENLDKASDIS